MTARKQCNHPPEEFKDYPGHPHVCLACTRIRVAARVARQKAAGIKQRKYYTRKEQALKAAVADARLSLLEIRAWLKEQRQSA